MASQASLDGTTFEVDPSSASWNFSAKVNETETLGGRVIQVFGTRIDDMRLSGTSRSPEDQEALFAWIKGLGRRQAAKATLDPAPYRFLMPERGWDFKVYIRSLQQQGSARSVQHDIATFAPGWTLTLFIVQDNSGLNRVAQNAFIKRISQGFGWEQTAFHGPLTHAEVEETLGGQTIEDYMAGQLDQYLTQGPEIAGTQGEAIAQ